MFDNFLKKIEFCNINNIENMKLNLDNIVDSKLINDKLFILLKDKLIFAKLDLFNLEKDMCIIEIINLEKEFKKLIVIGNTNENNKILLIDLENRLFTLKENKVVLAYFYTINDIDGNYFVSNNNTFYIGNDGLCKIYDFPTKIITTNDSDTTLFINNNGSLLVN